MTIFWGIAVLVTGVAFVVYINKAADPFITPEMLTNPAFAMTMIVIFVGYFFSYTLNAGCNAIGLNVYGIDSSQVSNLLVWSIINLVLCCMPLPSWASPLARSSRRSAARPPSFWRSPAWAVA